MQSSNPVFRRSEGFNGQSRRRERDELPRLRQRRRPRPTPTARQQAPVYGDAVDRRPG